MNMEISEAMLEKVLEPHKEEAVELLKEKDKVEEYLLKAEEKLKNMKTINVGMENVPLLISMVRSYIRKEYTNVPMMTIVGIVAAIIYVVVPNDLIPDMIPYVGIIDDAMVVAFTMKLVAADVEIYRDWRAEQLGM